VLLTLIKQLSFIIFTFFFMFH